ncbi:MAG: hypothetical protein LBQ47_05075 [Endomicrobium sp.]|jgi:hypothetical protein|nr:hypothetical protein [Endomicrobium sp.]
MKKTEIVLKLKGKDFRRLVGVKKETYKEMLKAVKRGYRKKGEEADERAN